MVVPYLKQELISFSCFQTWVPLRPDHNPNHQCSLLLGLVPLQQTNHGWKTFTHQGSSLVKHSYLLFPNLVACSSFYHSTIFVLGSVLGWAILARSLPSNSAFRTMIALGSSAAMLKLTKESLDHIDSRLGNTLGKK